jgi:outer membrane murein-binding lipoprotein Lpp
MSKQIENARLAWRQAQVDLQSALDALEKSVAETADCPAVDAARSLVARGQAEADNLLQRYITHVGKA